MDFWKTKQVGITRVYANIEPNAVFHLQFDVRDGNYVTPNFQDGHAHWYQYQSIKTQKAVFCTDTDEVLSTDRGWSLRHSQIKMLTNNILLLFHFCWCIERPYWILKSGLVWFLQVCNSELWHEGAFKWKVTSGKSSCLNGTVPAPVLIYVLECELGPKQGMLLWR